MKYKYFLYKIRHDKWRIKATSRENAEKHAKKICKEYYANCANIQYIKECQSKYDF